MNIARIDTGNRVVNIEIATDDWVNTEPGGPYTFVPYTDANPACVGYGYDPVTGIFEQPPIPTVLPEVTDVA